MIGLTALLANLPESAKISINSSVVALVGSTFSQIASFHHLNETPF